MDASTYRKPQPWVSQPPPTQKGEKDFPLSPDTVDLPMKSQHQVTCQPKCVCIIMWQYKCIAAKAHLYTMLYSMAVVVSTILSQGSCTA